MKKKKALLIMITVLTLCGMCTFGSFGFEDVSADAWYAADVSDVQKYGIINGIGNDRFQPQGTLTLAQAVTMAARTHAYLHHTTIPSNGNPWYRPYVDYAIRNGIWKKHWHDYDYYDRECSRNEMATLFYHVFPKDTAQELNHMEGLPDVWDFGRDEPAFYLYRQGVLTGGDSYGSFFPDHNITRAETAAILNRVLDPQNRKTYELRSSAFMSDQELLNCINAQALLYHQFITYFPYGAFFEQDWDDEIIHNGFEYTRVVDGMKSLSDVDRIWHIYFSKESKIPDWFSDLCSKCYCEVNGKVYSLNPGVGDDFKEMIFDRVIWRTDTKATLSGGVYFADETYTKLDEAECDLVLEDGVWKCLEFRVNGVPWDDDYYTGI